ncbi:class I SAM-dependent methyltransferase [soil metagenome]
MKCAVMAVATVLGWAVWQSGAADPEGGRTEYMGRTIAQTMHWTGASWLLRETREKEENASKMLDELGVEPGMTVADIGAGNGYHALKLAKMVGAAGKVIANDIQPEMLEMLEKRAGARGLADRIETVLGEFNDPKLVPESADIVMMVDVYHELSYPEDMLAGIRKALRPGGRLVLLEFRAEDPEVPIKELHKMSKEQVDRELEANGFRRVSAFDGLPWQHMLFYEVAGEGEEGGG